MKQINIRVADAEHEQFRLRAFEARIPIATYVQQQLRSTSFDTKLAIRAAKKLWLLQYQFTGDLFLQAITNSTGKKEFTLIEKFLRDRGLWVD
jgi:hypothetical protein